MIAINWRYGDWMNLTKSTQSAKLFKSYLYMTHTNTINQPQKYVNEPNTHSRIDVYTLDTVHYIIVYCSWWLWRCQFVSQFCSKCKVQRRIWSRFPRFTHLLSFPTTSSRPTDSPSLQGPCATCLVSATNWILSGYDRWIALPSFSENREI